MNFRSIDSPAVNLYPVTWKRLSQRQQHLWILDANVSYCSRRFGGPPPIRHILRFPPRFVKPYHVPAAPVSTSSVGLTPAALVASASASGLSASTSARRLGSGCVNSLATTSAAFTGPSVLAFSR